MTAIYCRIKESPIESPQLFCRNSARFLFCRTSYWFIMIRIRINMNFNDLNKSIIKIHVDSNSDHYKPVARSTK